MFHHYGEAYSSGCTDKVSAFLPQVNNQISSLGGDRASVILILTDGRLGDLPESQLQVQAISCTFA